MSLINKKNVFIEKRCLLKDKLIALVLINNICHSRNKNKKGKIQKYQNYPTEIMTEKTGTTEVHVLTYFQNFFLTEKEEFRCNHRMNTTSYY